MFYSRYGIFKNSHTKDLVPTKIDNSTLKGIIKAIGITILPYNGYQSVVQMSEEVKNIDDIPKGMIISGVLTTILYTLLAIGVIAILGIAKTKSTKTPIADIFKLFVGNKGSHIVNIIGVLTGFTTLLLSVYSRSRLLTKLSEYKIAPGIFSNIGLGSDTNKYLKGIPFYSILIVSFFSYIFTLVKKDSLEFLTDLTNLLTCFVFVFVNLGVLYNYYKKKKEEKMTPNNLPENKNKTFVEKFKDTVPVYAVVGTVTFTILLCAAMREIFRTSRS